MALEINTSLVTPSIWDDSAPSGVLTEDRLFPVGNGLAWRRVIVGVMAGPVVLYDYKDAAVTFSLAQIQALNGVLDGQWTGIKATGTTSYGFKAGK